MGLKDEQGMMAIGVALMLIVTLALFAGALWQYSMVEMKRVHRMERDMQALFLARGGAEAVMAAWLEESQLNRPNGPMKTLYYNLDSKQFQLVEPVNSLGHVNVHVHRIDDPDSDRDKLTEITAEAVVGGVQRRVKVTTYPHLLGHDDTLNWYKEQDGTIINSKYDPVDDLVIVRSKQPINFQKRARGFPEMIYSAPWILFESSLDLGYDQEDEYFPLLTDDSFIENRVLRIVSPVIFFDNVFLKEINLSSGSVKSSIVLELPSEAMGIPGFQIDPSLQGYYGQVYFDGQSVAKRIFNQTRSLLRRRITLDRTVALRNVDNETLGERAFYFKDGTDLANIKEGHLIPIPAHKKRSESLKGLDPFVWE